MAERGGFEPPVEFCPTHAFQACTFSRSVTSPRLGHWDAVRRRGQDAAPHGIPSKTVESLRKAPAGLEQHHP
jgi:hypothetical protein